MYTKNQNHMRYGFWDKEWDIQNFFSFWAIFCPSTPPNNPTKQNFERMKNESRDVIILHLCTKNHDHMMYASWNMECDRHNFLSLRAIFCPFTPQMLTPKIKIWKKCKNVGRHYPFTHVYHKWRSYDVWFLRYKTWQVVFLSFWAIFYPLTLLTTRKIKILKNEKNSWRYHNLIKCTKNDNHLIYSFWDMQCKRHNFLSFWVIFTLLPHLQPKKSKFWKNEKNTWRYISSCYTSVPKMSIICYTVPGIWHVMDVIFYFSFWVIFCPIAPLTPQKIIIKKKWKENAWR